MTARLLAAALLAVASPAMSQSLTGLWDATVKVGALDIPFRFEIKGDGSNVQGFFFNGEDRDKSTSGSFKNGALQLNWADYAATLEATLHNGVLEGKYTRAGRDERSTYDFHAVRAAAAQKDKSAPAIGGLWQIPTESSKGEKAWKFIVKQNGPDVSASILRIDGDTGAITGTYRDGKFVLSHFSGARPMLLEVSFTPEGSLELLQNGKTRMTAIRWEQARAMNLPEPTDPLKHTGVKNSNEAFQFRFADLNGNIVSNTDARFRGKVVLVNITGSWCPNCHDEAPFLVDLYHKYRSRGLELVGLSFEEADQLKDPSRLRAFVKKYGIDYTVLLCGAPDEAKEKLAQASNWNAWPTTFFLGRDGLVRNVHAGFPSSATGDLHRQAKEEFASEVERLLRENEPTTK